jgi:glycosyltransferase involved in cell wall biosynthesis
MTRPLRIGIVTPGWAGPGGEVALPALEDHVRPLTERHQVVIVALRHPRLPAPYRWEGAAVHPLAGGARAGILGRGSLLGRAVKRLVSLHRQRPFDVLHGLWADEAGCVATVAGRVLGVPTLVSVLGGELASIDDIGYGAALGTGGRWTSAVALRGAALVSVGSESLFRAVASRAPGAPLMLQPLGVDVSVFRPSHGHVPVASNLLCVGALTPVKDPVTVLRAFARVVVTRPQVTLDFVGDGPLRDGLGRLALRLGVGSQVRLRGAVVRSALPDRYQASNVLIIGSRHEAQSMVACEAAASGLPVVGTAVGAVLDLEIAGAALTAPPRDPLALAEALGAVLDDHRLAARMGEAGRVAAEHGYDLRQTTTALQARYLELAQ